MAFNRWKQRENSIFSAQDLLFLARWVTWNWPETKDKKREREDRTGSGSFVSLFGFFSSKKKSISPNLISHLSNKKLDFRINRFNFENERLGAFDLILIKYLNDYEFKFILRRLMTNGSTFWKNLAD